MELVWIRRMGSEGIREQDEEKEKDNMKKYF
jgi:hypothetical protein